MTEATRQEPPERQPSALERFLRLFATVRAEEGATGLMLLASIFLILTAYYFIKPVREGWLTVSVIKGLSKLEVKAYAAFAQSLVLIAVLPLYSRFAARWSRRAILTRSGIFFGGMMIVFWLLNPGFIFTQVPYSGVAFYLFVGIFSVTLVAQFWGFAADLYGAERGKRLFPLIAIGASGGAVFGSWLGERLIRLQHIGSFELILLALLPLTAAIVLARKCDRRGAYGRPSEAQQSRWAEPAAPTDEGALKPIFKQPYLAAVAMMILIFSWVVASGDNILYGIVQHTLEIQFEDTPDLSIMIREATTAFYSNLYFWVNLVGLLLQAFIVSRIVSFGGFGMLLFTTPLVSLAAYLSMAIAPIIGVVKVMKIAENASNYSINNTARHMMWLPTSKANLYQTKTAVDTLFVRVGDGLAAVTVMAGTRIWAFDINTFLWINVALIVVWLALAWSVIIGYRRLQLGNRDADRSAQATAAGNA